MIMKPTSRRKLAAVASVAALSALGASALALTPASAGNAPRLTVDTTALRAAAGTCTVVTVTPVDQFGVTSSAPDTVTVTLSESPSSASQDLDFCTTGAATPDEDPSYTNGATFDVMNQGAYVQSYKAGPGINGNGSTSGGNPDAADNSTQSTPNTSGTGGKYATTNPSGVDRARYVYRPASGGIRVGVVGLTPGTGTIKAFFDDGTTASSDKGDYTPESEETQAPPVTFTVTAGGQPGSAEAAAAVSSIDVQPTDDAGAPGTPQAFAATLRNASGDTVRGVTPQVQVAANGANPSATPRCDESDNAGVSRCSFTGVNPGTDVLTVYVNRAGGTAGLDSGEISQQVTRTTTKPAVAAANARYIALTPKNAALTSGKSDTFTATITDVNGAPAQGVFVVFSESGPGQFSNGASTINGTSDATGRVQVRVDSAATESGTETITATIGTTGTQCSQAAGAGSGATSTTPAGNCADTVTQTITSASPTPSKSPSATPTVSISPTSTRQDLGISTSTPNIQPNQVGVLDVTGQPNSPVELECYTRPNTDYFTARGPINLTSSGTTQFRILPGANTRCYVRYAGDDSTASPTIVINVHTTLSLSAVKQSGVRNYLFQGRNLPRRPGQLITLYRIDNTGKEIRTANLTTDSSGIYKVSRHFTGTGTFLFRVRTSQTLNNAAGASTTYRLTIR
jgi:hypothetical protein